MTWLMSCRFYVLHLVYRKTPKNSDTWKFAVITLRVMHPKDAEGIANSVDPDQIAPLGAVWSGSALFAQASVSENLGSLRYFLQPCLHMYRSNIYICNFISWSPSMQSIFQYTLRQNSFYTAGYIMVCIPRHTQCGGVLCYIFQTVWVSVHPSALCFCALTSVFLTDFLQTFA